jgi:hypothetical protein
MEKMDYEVPGEAMTTFTTDVKLEGATLGNEIPLEEGNNYLTVTAHGGCSEFRVCLQNASGETRDACPCFTVVFGQGGNTRTTMGSGNPFGPVVYTTEHPDALLPRGHWDKTFWIFFDRASGWVFVGAGTEPTPYSVLLGGVDRSLRRNWSHISFSNWRDPVSFTYRIGSVQGEPLLLARHKFDKYGQLTRFEGITVVSHHGVENRLHQAMLTLQAMIRSNPLLECQYALLPPPSFHVTCADLLSFTAEAYDGMQASDHDRLRRVVAAVDVDELWSLLPSNLVFTPTGELDPKGMVVRLEPDEATAAALANWRLALETSCGDVTCHAGYIFHSTFAYLLYPISSSEAQAAFSTFVGAARWILQSVGPIAIQRPELTRFSDMGEFVKIAMRREPADGDRGGGS